MYRRVFLLFIIMLVCAGSWAWWRNVHSAQVPRIKEETGNTVNILMKDKEKFESHFKPEVKKNKFWTELNDYTIGAVSLVNKSNAKDLFKLADINAKSLAVCIEKDFCGMQRRSDDDSYFDETKTPGHIFLGRNLEILIESMRLYPELKYELDWDLIYELTDSENEKIQVLSLEIIKDYDIKSADAEALIDVAEKYKGSAKAGALEKIANADSLKDRSLLLNSLERSFASDDPHTVISIVEKIKRMHLSENEISKVSKNLCRFKENGIDDPNWKMIKYDMKKLADLEKICN